MLKAQEMVKLRVFCQKDQVGKVIGALYDAKAIDIIQHSKSDDLDIGSPLNDSEEISDTLVKIRSIMYQLKIEPTPAVANGSLKYFKTKVRETRNLHSELTDSMIKLKTSKERLNFLNNALKLIKGIQKMGLSPDMIRDTRYISCIFGYVDDVDGLKAQLRADLKTNYALNNDNSLIALYVDQNMENEALGIIRKYHFSEIKVAEELKKKSVKNILNEIIKLKKEINSLDTKISKIKKIHEKDLIATEQALSHMSKKSDAPLMFAETKQMSIISGWVPEKTKLNLFKKLKKITSHNIIIEELDIKKEDSVPIKLDNPAFAKPYEFLLQLFSMPNYKELDPTILMFITFPLFFGFMLGDIGYGIVTLLLFMFLKMKMPSAKALLNIMIFCSISSIIFGGVFGEAFGFELTEVFGEHSATPVDTHADPHAEAETYHAAYPLIHRSADTALDLIKLSIIIGFFHVNLGLLLGFINVFRQHGWKHAIFEKAAWFVLEGGVALIALSSMGMLMQSMMYLGFALCLAAAVMLFLGEGVQGLVELPSIFVHIGSYMRLMAIGLASVGLAVVINQQTIPLFSQGIIGIIGGILIFTVGHTINIALGIIGPFLHSLRLHYVEHFTKFYNGGGKEFNPFGA